MRDALRDRIVGRLDALELDDMRDLVSEVVIALIEDGVDTPRSIDALGELRRQLMRRFVTAKERAEIDADDSDEPAES